MFQAKACYSAISKFCPKRPDTLECLKQQDVRKLEPSCRKKLFQEEEEEVLQNRSAKPGSRIKILFRNS
jgi:hypothetical protein